LGVSLHRENSLVKFLRWAYAGVDRTIFMALKFTFPSRFVSPLGFLGMLTFVIFIILGITGALLMLWYEPILDRAWDSVENINDVIPYGFHMRNIHYHASNPMVMAITGAIMLTGGVFPVEMGLKFDPNVPPGITVPEWYLTGLYAFLRTQYDKFVTGVAWPGLFIFALLIVPFIDRYKKFSWKDRPLVTAIGITSLAQIIVTTYWGFYIDPDRTKSLLERLVIDPIFFYLVMVLLVPLSFGFTYMMIRLAKNAEANAKLQPKKPGSKTSISLPEQWIYIVFIALLAFQVYLNIAAYYAVLAGMKNYSLFIIGIIMLVFAAMFHLFRYGRAVAKSPSPKIITAPPKPTKPAISPPTETPPLPSQSREEKPLVTPAAQKSLGTSTSQGPSSSQTGKSAAGTTATDIDRKVSTSQSGPSSSAQAHLTKNNIKNTVNSQSDIVASYDKTSGENPADKERQKV